LGCHVSSRTSLLQSRLENVRGVAQVAFEHLSSRERRELRGARQALEGVLFAQCRLTIGNDPERAKPGR